MKAALFTEFQGPITIETVPDPISPPGGVVVMVKANGVCRSDWHGWQGHDGDIQTLPHVPGHELAGEVVAVGAGVQKWQVGDRVTVPFCLGCGACPQCDSGNQQVCDKYAQPGFTIWGSFAEYVALPYADENIVRVPESLSYVDVASLGCRFTTAFRAVVAQGRVQPGEWMAVYGCGGVGLSAVIIAAASGANVIAVDINDDALDLARASGADVTVNGAGLTDGEVVAIVREASGSGVHLSLDALGSAPTCRNSILSLRKRGRHVQVGLLKGEHENPWLPMGPVIANELEIYGSHGMQAHAYPGLLEMVVSGKLDLSQLVTQRIHLNKSPAALTAMTSYRNVGMTVIDRFD